MSIRKVSFVDGEYYHIYNRGNSKQTIFHDKQDYQYFIKLLYISNNVESFNLNHMGRSSNFNSFSIGKEVDIVAIGAYVLMPNHFHILLTQTEEGGISKFIQKLSTAYVMYYNKKYKRTGGLFEGKFKAQYVNNDRYLKYLFSYIHLNPIKLIQKDWKEKGIKNKKEALVCLNDYNYSSFIDYINPDRPQNKILNVNKFPKYFPTKKDFLKEIFEWIGYDKMH